MDYLCSVCGKALERDLPVVVSHTENHIVDIIKKDHPDWVEADGMCKRCYEYYKRQLHPEED